MKRVLSLATTGLFLAGLAMVPMSARADQATVGGKTVTPTHTDSTMAPKPTTSGVTSTDPVKKDEKVTATPSTSAPASSTIPTKTPGKGAS